MAAAATTLNAAPLFIVEDDEPTIHSVASKLRRACHAEGIKLAMIDYLQLMEGAKDDRRESVEQMSRMVKRLAKSLDIHILLVSQLSRGPESRQDKRPRLSDLRETGGIEQDADNVLMVYRPDYYQAPEKRSDEGGVTELILPKQRNGPTGVVSVYFRKRFLRFENLARHS